MPSIDVPLNGRSYTVHVGSGILGHEARWKDLHTGGSSVVVSNDRVAPLYLDGLLDVLPRENTHSLVLPDGEATKNVENWLRIMDFLAEHHAGRDTCLVALGGGVIGDLCGFAAATWMRGVACVQVPTTLLAQVDASVGGKTGVNHPDGKNLIGAFHQPLAVIADIDTLDSLPEREFRAGLAEVVKYGAILDLEFFEWLTRHAHGILARQPDELMHVVTRSVAHKAAIVARDERESGVRAILNFGHSFAHALESLTGYERYLHGEAVAIGMRLAATLSERRGLLEDGFAERLGGLLRAFGLGIQVDEDLETDAIVDHMALDKKNLAGRRRLVLLDRPGHAVVDAGSTDEQVHATIDACRRD